MEHSFRWLILFARMKEFPSHMPVYQGEWLMETGTRKYISITGKAKTLRVLLQMKIFRVNMPRMGVPETPRMKGVSE